jgi:hypothetical protein
VALGTTTIASLNTAAIAALETASVAALTTDQIPLLTTAQIVALEAADLAALDTRSSRPGHGTDRQAHRRTGRRLQTADLRVLSHDAAGRAQHRRHRGADHRRRGRARHRPGAQWLSTAQIARHRGR